MRDRRPFWEKVAKGGPDECWPWLGYRKPSGHGLTQYKSMPIHASRKAWILTHGMIPGDLCVNHKCDNAACCNPAHMYLGTRKDNMIDYWRKTPPNERKGGRKHLLSEDELERLWALRRSGTRLVDCAKEFGVHRSTIVRYVSDRWREKLEKIMADRLAKAQN